MPSISTTRPTRASSRESAFPFVGPVRVSQVDEFVSGVLRDNGYDIIAVNAAFASGDRPDVSVRNPVPIFTTYFTAWANRNGVVSFRDDIYEFDKTGKTDFPRSPDLGDRADLHGLRTPRSPLRVRPAGNQIRVAAIDATTGIEVIIIAP